MNSNTTLICMCTSDMYTIIDSLHMYFKFWIFPLNGPFWWARLTVENLIKAAIMQLYYWETRVPEYYYSTLVVPNQAWNIPKSMFVVLEYLSIINNLIVLKTANTWHIISSSLYMYWYCAIYSTTVFILHFRTVPGQRTVLAQIGCE